MFERYSERARQTLFFARYELSEKGGRAIEPEHLLLGLLRVRPAATVRVLESCGTSVEALQEAVTDSLAGGEKVSTSVEVPFAEQTVQILKCAADEADRLGHAHIRSLHLLLGVLRVEESSAASILRAHGVELAAARERAAADEESEEGPPRWGGAGGEPK